MTPSDFGFELNQEILRGAVTTATLDKVIAQLPRMSQLRENALALPALVRATELGENDAWFNRACVHARLGQSEEAITALRSAIAFDAENRAHALQDDDFVSLRGRPDFVQLTSAPRTA